MKLLQDLLLEGLQVAQVDPCLIEKKSLVKLVLLWIQFPLLELRN
jgi:hypothetical protein